MIDCQTASMDELQAEFVRLADVLSCCTADRNAIADEMHRRKTAAAAVSRLSAMSASTRDALKLLLDEGP